MLCFRAKSIKTRIETEEKMSAKNSVEQVLEQNPSKQGLKQFRDQKVPNFSFLCFRAKSIKTRIETQGSPRNDGVDKQF